MALSIKGRKLSLAWLKPPPVPPDGNMSLYDHLRELRYRLVFSVAAIALGMAASAFFYNPYLYDWVLRPLNIAKADLAISHPELNIQAVNTDVTAPFLVAIKIVALSGAIVTSPIWLHQLWAFIVPGLLSKEKKWARTFVGIATPLFLAGCATGYLLLPKGVGVLVGFTPEGQDVDNLLQVETFLGFLIRVVLVFGISYLIPLVMLLLNLLGIVTAAQMKRFRPFIILISFVFAAMVTPTTDPFSMIAMALPMTILLMITEQIAKVSEKRRAARAENPDDPTSRDTVLQELEALDEQERAEKAALEAGDTGADDTGADDTEPAKTS